jgi:hypothetical protein
MTAETKATSLHEQILNISAVSDLPPGYRILFTQGHRDARHAAAELAAEYEAGVAQLVEALESIESMYDDETSVGELSNRLYEARGICRAALLSHKGER